MAISLFQQIQALHPEITSDDFLTVITLQDDGSGPYIREWNHPTIAQPTQAELDSVDEAAYLNGKALETLRAKRNQLLTETDWVTLKAIDDSNDGLGIQLPQVWMDYRQALRDLPANTVDPANPVWPVKPGGN
jgi:hypothetical protein